MPVEGEDGRCDGMLDGGTALGNSPSAVHLDVDSTTDSSSEALGAVCCSLTPCYVRSRSKMLHAVLLCAPYGLAARARTTRCNRSVNVLDSTPTVE